MLKTIKQRHDELEALAANGDDKIVALAKKLGIRAVPDRPCACLVAELLKHGTESIRDIGVNPWCTTPHLGWIVQSGEVHSIRMGRNLARVACRFDTGHFPELEL